MRRLLIVSPYQYLYLPLDGGRPHAGGSEHQVKYLIDHILERESDTGVTIVTNGVEGVPPLSTCDGVKVHSVLRPRPGPAGILHNLLATWRVIRRESVTHVYVKTDPSPFLALALVRRFLPSRLVFSFGMGVGSVGRRGWVSRLHHRAFLHALRSADLIQCQTEGQQDELRGLGMEGMVVPNVIPEDRFVEGTEGRYLLWVGRMDERTKRPHLFVRLARELPGEAFVLVGVRQSDQADYLDRILRGIDELENITYLDYVPPEEIMGCFSRAKALVNTSTEEGFPNTFLEAWLMGKPVVSFLVNPDGVLDDPRMGAVLDDPAGIMEYVAGAGGEEAASFRREHVLQNHNPEVELARLMDRIGRL